MPTKRQPLFDWPGERRSGVLLHPTALPGTTGIGTLGAQARSFVDALAKCGFSLWQTCPLGPTGFGDSPYQCLSAFAGNPYLIDLDELAALGLLTPAEIEPSRTDAGSRVDYGALWETRPGLLRLAARRAEDREEALTEAYGPYTDFLQEQKDWLEPYALFRAWKEHFDFRPWYEWPEKYRSHARCLEIDPPENVVAAARAEKWLQYLFFGQWRRLRKYAADKGIAIVGDIPIFVALDGADAWQHPEYFQLKVDLKPKAVAGVPPDYFSETGQLWGNPLYDWKKLSRDGYDWWIRRFRLNFALFDWVRIDHFRGFEAAYRIPANAKDARSGKWEKGPGIDFFEKVHKSFPEARIILEDLGIITPEVNRMREETGLPGMAVLHFAFDNPDNRYLPHNLEHGCILYPGSHDNDTTAGWYANLPAENADYLRRYLRVSGEETAWDLIRTGYESVADFFIVPFQDLLSLGSDARFNTPGTAQGNWDWRADPGQIETVHRDSATYLRELSYLYHRNANPAE